tara:strand:+ start:1369 stop:1626 length:258 start_codon:yes stop_codon:yes gene_type:complete
MGRAIDMEKDIDKLRAEVERLNNIIRGMSSELTEVTEALFEEEEVVEETKKEKKENGKKKANTKGNGKSDKSSDKSSGDVDPEAG